MKRLASVGKLIDPSSPPPPLLYARDIDSRKFESSEESVKIIAVFSEADVNFDATQDADINSRRMGKKKKENIETFASI